MLFVVAFSASMLAAFGVDRLLRGEERRRYVIGAAVALGLVTLLAVSGALTNMSLGLEAPRGPETVLANEGALKGGGLRMLMFGALACAMAFLMGTRRLTRGLAGALIIAIVGLDLWSVVRHYWIFSAPASVLYAPDAAIAYLQRQPGPFRVFTPTGEYTLFREYPGRDPILRYDGLMPHGIPVLFGYHGNHIAKYDLLTSDPRQLGNPNLWRLTNLRYFMTNMADLGVEGTKVVAGPVKNANGNEVYIHQTPVETSYAWITPVIVKAAEDAVAATVLDPRFDVRQAALFDTSAAVEGQDVQSLPAPLTIQAKVTRYAPGAATIELDAPAPAGSALMVSENYYPGWTATADGKPAVVGRADVSLIGVALPAGARTIELTFINLPYKTGRTITWLAVLAALVAWAGGAMAGRRRQASV
jgi:hypothetical protein